MAKVTSSEVAKRAGVSVGTVSRIVNNLGAHSPETVGRVRAAMHELGYLPPRSGAQQKKKSTRQIALVFPDLDRSPTGMVTPLGFALAQGAEEVFAGAGDQLLVTQLRGTNQLPICIADETVGGILIRDGTVPENLLNRMSTLPSVWVYGLVAPAPIMDLVAVDNYRLGKMAADKILTMAGISHCLLVNPIGRFVEEFHLRLFSCRHNLSTRGVSVESVEIPDLVAKLQGLPKGKVALFVPGHDQDLLSVHRLLSEAELKPGQLVPIVSAVTDHERIKIVNPHLCCISINPLGIGRIAAQQLLWRMEYFHEPARTVLVMPREV